MENTNFITDAGWNEFINSSYAELYDIVIESYEDYYIKDPLTITVQPGSNTIDLPSDFYKLKGIDYQEGLNPVQNNDWIDLRLFDFAKRNRNTNLSRVIGNQPYKQYRILGDKIYIIPTENAGGSYRLWYNPPITTLVDDTDEIDGVNGWEEYIVVDAGIKALVKEESSTTDLERAKQKLLDRIESSSKKRDVHEPNSVSDYESNYDDYLGINGGYF
jgi:hypothetical protein